MVDITIVNGVYKPTYNWGAPSWMIKKYFDGPQWMLTGKVFSGPSPTLDFISFISFLAIEREQSSAKGKRHKHFFVDYKGQIDHDIGPPSPVEFPIFSPYFPMFS